MNDEPDFSDLREEVLTIVAALIHSRGLSVQDFYAILGIDTSRHDNHESALTSSPALRHPVIAASDGTREPRPGSDLPLTAEPCGGRFQLQVPTN
jgi:hypothetical protein